MLTLKNKITLNFRLKSYHPYYLNRFIILTQNNLSRIQFIKTYERFTLLRSPHVDIRARDQFERITHNKIITLSFFSNDIDIKQTIMRITKLMQNFALGLDVSMTSSIKSSSL